MTTEYKVHVTFPGRLVVIGFGSIGQGVLPLILRHVGGLARERITIVTADDAGLECAREYGIRFVKQPLSRENFRQVLEPMVGRGDFVLNVSVDVSSIALVKFCWERGALYLDTCIEPWPGGYTDLSLSPSSALRLRIPHALRSARGGIGSR
jgi:homospermidine synthase